MDDPLSQIQFYAPGISAIICLVASLFLLLMSAFASGSEIAFFSLTPKDLSELDSDNVKDKKILMLREDSERTLATILITNNFINVTIIMLLNYFFSQIVDFGTAYWLHFLVESSITCLSKSLRPSAMNSISLLLKHALSYSINMDCKPFLSE